jgi:hypothetical protein
MSPDRVAGFGPLQPTPNTKGDPSPEAAVSQVTAHTASRSDQLFTLRRQLVAAAIGNGGG